MSRTVSTIDAELHRVLHIRDTATLAGEVAELTAERERLHVASATDQIQHLLDERNQASGPTRG